MRIAILDDYQNVATDLADFEGLATELDAELTVFNEHLGHDDATVCAALKDFDVIVAMRERTPFPASRFQLLPNLKLLVTTGRRNGAIDLEAHGRARRRSLAHRLRPHRCSGAYVGVDLSRHPPIGRGTILLSEPAFRS